MRYEPTDIRLSAALLAVIVCGVLLSCRRLIDFLASGDFTGVKRPPRRRPRRSLYPAVMRLSAQLPPEPRLEQLDRMAGVESSDVYKTAGRPGKGPQQLRADRGKGIRPHPHPAGHQSRSPAHCRSARSRPGRSHRRQRPAGCGRVQFRPHVPRSHAIRSKKLSPPCPEISCGSRADMPRCTHCSHLLARRILAASLVAHAGAAAERRPRPYCKKVRLRPAAERTGAVGPGVHRRDRQGGEAGRLLRREARRSWSWPITGVPCSARWCSTGLRKACATCRLPSARSSTW